MCSNAGVVGTLDKLQPVGYAADPLQMAAGVHILSWDDAGYVIGHDLAVDGRATAERAAVGA